MYTMKEGTKVEYFELLKDDGTKLGKVKERGLVHIEGDLHGGSHVWVVRQKENQGLQEIKYEVLLQKRNADKDSFPGCLDVSCAGHMDQGETFLSTALRELQEELNLEVDEKKLHFLFSQIVEGKYVFHGKPFWNREVNYVYLLSLDVPLDTLFYQKEEIDSLIWMDLEKLMESVRAGQKEFCIWREEMEKLYAYIKDKMS